MGEENLLLESTSRTYRARWWILMLSSFHFMHQNVGLNTWGPIAQSAKGAYDWEDTTIVFILNMGRLGSILYICIGSYLLDKAGLRVAMITYSVNMLISNSLRSLSKNKEVSFILITIGEFLNGCNGVTSFAAPPILAARWFPPGERITASAIMVLSAYVGDGLSSLIGPVIVEKPNFANNSIANDSTLTNGTTSDLLVANADEILDEVMIFLYIQCGVSAVLMIATVAYFPDKPSSAPSTSAAMSSLNYRESFWKLVTNKRLVFLVLVFGIMVGVYMSWIMVIDIIFDPMGISQLNAGWITFYTIITGSILGFIIARFSDIFMKRLKPILLTLFVFTITAFLWIALIASEILPYSTWQLYVSAIVGGSLLNASFPLWYEIVSEMSFPIPGGIINGISDVIFLIFANVFFVLMYIPVSDYRWMTWIMFVCSMLGFVTLVFFPVTYIRTDIDLEAKEVNDNQGNELDNITLGASQMIECTSDKES
ncbi:disrupted in renal carcinoma protein 2 homolog [Mizuhopecten yessoensis]|uniref:Disrupted in renal carcinoma protein 2-like n=1 Tax=Mizuhopecten yessoensis TaxID=6573 RepID=A0A210PSY2_MIZYE|nr:disrupted in renal carcinoma protein 2 homolog [Mizuhopecten yessoensis]OWF39572.1 Disrupted in renal carcinoma protein 2-like [Mizuhopecten yessoensis]